MSNLTEKWSPILNHQDLPEIKDPYRKAVTAQLLENQEKFLNEQAAMGESFGLLSEAPTMSVNASKAIKVLPVVPLVVVLMAT